MYSNGIAMNDLWLRERERRQAIGQLADMQPGDRSARPILKRLDDLERLDRETPLGACQLDFTKLAELPREPHPIGCWIICDQDIPQPWMTRFAIALGPAGRVSEGLYWHDWIDFLQAWKRDLAHLEQHRMAIDEE